MTTPRTFVFGTLMILMTHGAIWAYPVAPAGVANLAAFFAWCIALLVLAGAIAMVFREPGRELWEHPRLVKIGLRASRWGGIAWLVYHGIFALPAVLLLGIGIAWVARRAHAENERGAA